MQTYHVWELIEILLTAENKYDDPYNHVDVFVDLEGPSFSRRCYGFWDGGATFKVRILANAAGGWKWTSGSNQNDAGLNGQHGSFKAIDWSESELEANPTRRGMIRATENGHALEYADGTPFFLLGDTWWATPSWRFIWREESTPYPEGKEMGFKDMVQFRKNQGFNSVTIMACFPNWKLDGQPARWQLDDEKRTLVRAAWNDPDTGSALDMHNEGGLPFEYPGTIPGYPDAYPDVTKLNPEFFKILDKKIDYLNENGFTPFLEVLRRDAVQAWFIHYPWPDSYLRYVSYLFNRYQANSMVLSPIHYDYSQDGIHAKYFNDIMAEYLKRYGKPPFGTMISANAPSSTLSAFGDQSEAPWIDLHQIGNVREHEFHWSLTEIFHADPPKPALDGEPYYSTWGLNVGYYKLRGAPNSPEDDRCVRNGMYGTLLSGGLAGYIYGTSGIVRAEREDSYIVKMWDAIHFTSAEMISHFKKFVFSEGNRYQELIPNADIVSPNKTHELTSFEGWAFGALTKEKDLVLVYYEKGCPSCRIRSVKADGVYQATWFDPRTGQWLDAGQVVADCEARIAGVQMPQKPSDDDWALKLKLIRVNSREESISGVNPSTIFGTVGSASPETMTDILQEKMKELKNCRTYEDVKKIQDEIIEMSK